MLKAEIQSYFARLSPLPLTFSEKIRLTNSQLVPALAYRLITHSLCPDQLEKLQSLIRAGVASQSITHLVTPKDRFAACPKGRIRHEIPAAQRPRCNCELLTSCPLQPRRKMSWSFVRPVQS